MPNEPRFCWGGCGRPLMFRTILRTGRRRAIPIDADNGKFHRCRKRDAPRIFMPAMQDWSKPVECRGRSMVSRPRHGALSSAVLRSVALTVPPDFSLVPPKAPEPPAESNPAGARIARRVPHLDVIHRLRLGNGCPAERALGPHPILAAQQLVAVVRRPLVHHNVSRVSHHASPEAACSSCRETQGHRRHADAGSPAFA